MRKYLQALPLGAEFAIVILGGFGFLFLGAFVTVLTKAGAGDAGSTGEYTADHLIQVIVYELPVGAALLAFLHLRGWSLERLGVRFSAIETLVGFGLAFFAELACYVPLIAVALRRSRPRYRRSRFAGDAGRVRPRDRHRPRHRQPDLRGDLRLRLRDHGAQGALGRADRGHHQHRHPPALPSLSGADGVLRHRAVRSRWWPGGTRGAAGCGPSSSRTASAISSHWSRT